MDVVVEIRESRSCKSYAPSNQEPRLSVSSKGRPVVAMGRVFVFVVRRSEPGNKGG